MLAAFTCEKEMFSDIIVVCPFIWGLLLALLGRRKHPRVLRPKEVLDHILTESAVHNKMKSVRRDLWLFYVISLFKGAVLKGPFSFLY